MKRIFLSLIVFIVFGVSSLFAQNYTCKKWEVLDMPFVAKGKITSPFDIDFGAVISDADGRTMKIPGFYNDDKTWVIRFCPPEEGKWTYTTYSTVPSMTGKKGSIEVGPKTKADEHGPIVIPENNKKRFAYADGTPYFLLAFELDWLFALDWDNPNGIPKTENIVSHLVENKFNQVVMNVYAYDANWGDRASIKPEHNYAKPKVFPYGGDNENPDYSILNIDFFKHLDRVMDHLDEKEIISHLMIYVWNKKVNWPEPESKADNLYFDYVVKRYQAYPNLIWDISKEALAYGRDDMNYITRRIDRLKTMDAHGRLLSVHDYSYCDNFPGKVDFISIQNWRPNVYDMMVEVAKKHDKQPVFNIEHGGYEKTMHSIFDGSFNDPVTCLERNYECVFAGTYSTYYWQNTSWYEVVYNPEDLPKENQPAFVYYKNLVKLFEDYDFSTLKPFQKGFNTYSLTDNKKNYLFMASTNMIEIAGTLNELKGKKAKVKWYDPFTGEYHDSGIKDFSNGTWLGLHKNKNITSPFCVAILEVMD